MRRFSKFQASSKRGFTLIEVLIVVVIIGVLAALIIPRMVASIEKAKTAEAYTRIGALWHAQKAYMNSRGSSVPLNFTCADPPSDCGASELIQFGMADFPQKNFKYACDGSGTDWYCAASRWGVAGSPYIAYYYAFVDESYRNKWECGNGYVRVEDGEYGPSEIGCNPGW